MDQKTLIKIVVAILVLVTLVIVITKRDSEKLPMVDENLQENPVDKPVQMNNEIPSHNPQPTTSTGELKTATFSGILEKVDVGCYADGECYVDVDGKHVTAIMGWSRETVGGVIGVEGFGDLENHIGSEIEVYAQENSTGSYTLYGDEEFFIKVK